MDRHVIVQEPFCDWAVDATNDVPATVDSQVAIGLSLSEAIFLAAKPMPVAAGLSRCQQDCLPYLCLATPPEHQPTHQG